MNAQELADRLEQSGHADVARELRERGDQPRPPSMNELIRQTADDADAVTIGRFARRVLHVELDPPDDPPAAA